MGGHLVLMRERRNAYRILVLKPKGKRSLRRNTHRWEDSIKMDLREVECGQHGLDSFGSEYGQVVGPCECSKEHSGSMKGIGFLNQLRKY